MAFLGLLDTWPPETQNWAEKEANGLDPEVLAEIDREREAFLAAQQGQASGELFSAIEGNYADAVRLLTTAPVSYTHLDVYKRQGRSAGRD
ncbi:enterobactin synthase component F [Klebsiella pneumoniae]|nr:thioesterase domain-containing protein [Klebsiella pneumoniae]OUH27068.1 enterobactin synthase component F [Klebsiella pneumoniae]